MQIMMQFPPLPLSLFVTKVMKRMLLLQNILYVYGVYVECVCVGGDIPRGRTKGSLICIHLLSSFTVCIHVIDCLMAIHTYV